jgi:hypothetical protein
MIISSKIFYSLILCSIPVLSFSQAKLQKKNFIDNKVELLVPADFKPMAQDLVDFKYQNSINKPSFVLTNKDVDVNIAFQLQEKVSGPVPLEAYKKHQLEILKKSMPDAEWKGDSIVTINGRKVGYFKVITPALNERIYNYFFFTNLDDKVLLISFNCVESLLPKWENIAEQIVGSLKIL